MADENPMFRKREPPTWQPYGQPAPGQSYGDQQFQPSRGTNGLAITSLILSIASFVALPLIGSIGGVVCGHIARGQLRRSREYEQGDGLALAGVIVGWIGIAFYVGLIALIVIGLGLSA